MTHAHPIVIKIVAALLLVAPSHAQTESDAQRKAVAKYPALGQQGSPIHTRFMELFRDAKQNNPTLFNSPSWPLTLANKAASTLPKTPAQIAIQQKLIGVWNTTDGSGVVVAFDSQWRLLLFGVQFANTNQMLSDTSGKTTYEIDVQGQVPIIRTFNAEENGNKPVDEWRIKSLEGDKMELIGVQRNQDKTKPAPFVRVNPNPPAIK